MVKPANFVRQTEKEFNVVGLKDLDSLVSVRSRYGTGTGTCQKSEPDRNRNFSKVGTGTVKNSYGCITLKNINKALDVVLYKTYLFLSKLNINSL